MTRGTAKVHEATLRQDDDAVTAAVWTVGGVVERAISEDFVTGINLRRKGWRLLYLQQKLSAGLAAETMADFVRQRQRWAEGGLQRFLDYWPALFSDRLRGRQQLDLIVFFLLQYGLPVVSFADLSTSVITRTAPTFWPLSIVAFSVSALAYRRGCRGTNLGPSIPAPGLWNLLVAIRYLGLWFVVIRWVTVRMAVLPKRLVWAKTSHGEQEPVQA